MSFLKFSDKIFNKLPYYFKTINAISLSFLKFSDAYSIDDAFLITAIRTKSLSFFKFSEKYYNKKLHYYTVANATSLSLLIFSDAY